MDNRLSNRELAIKNAVLAALINKGKVRRVKAAVANGIEPVVSPFKDKQAASRGELARELKYGSRRPAENKVTGYTSAFGALAGAASSKGSFKKRLGWAGVGALTGGISGEVVNKIRRAKASGKVKRMSERQYGDFKKYLATRRAAEHFKKRYKED